MHFRLTTTSILFSSMLLTHFAKAQECPPGAWFCDTPQQGQPPVAQPLPPPPPPPSPPPPASHHRHSHHAERPIEPVGPLQPPPPPPPPKQRWRPLMGANLRLEGAIFTSTQNHYDESGLGGFGVSMRYRPVQQLALDVGLDIIGGTDYNGLRRTEVPISVSGMVFLNPTSPVQVYGIGGLHISHAEVEQAYYVPGYGITEYLPDTASTATITDSSYDYLGMHMGLGIEFKITRHVGVAIDLIGFMRGRIDGSSPPEFADPSTDRTSNGSGGGLFRAGMTFWW